MTINFNDKESLFKNGFTGFKSVSFLLDNMKTIPDQTGVYLVLYEGSKTPEFRKKGTGGFFKGRDPNVSIAELKANWVEKSNVVYIGKAGGGNTLATLRKRLNQYFRFGNGQPAGHYGGRLIWQIENPGNLIICWKALSDFDPSEYERELIAEFKRSYNMRPFANLTD
ncbi:MAG: hypothetical protein IPN68_13990 [Bacteroidetes bacterium]|nr:hypothetical protein [Bacteroidota bacterium]